MKKRPSPVISPRKTPRQARSSELVRAILEAAVRVLEREGAARFTTVRVAEEAGVSVGSLYQYFPNKEALLFRLQADEWSETGDILGEILDDRRMTPLDRLRRTVVVFFRSEREEAELRVALKDGEALYRNAPEAHEHRTIMTKRMLSFMAEALPEATPKERAFAAELVSTSMSAVAKRITEQGRSRAEVDAWAKACAEMYCFHLRGLGASTEETGAPGADSRDNRRLRG
jgi:AcrR family transcriptional regulator